MFKKTRIALGASLALGPWLIAGTAQAQAPAPAQDQVQRIEITGSNIKRVDLETSSPVQVISREEIKRSGANSVKELLDQLVSASGTLSDINGSNSFASGASSANLRNLGKTSTLILFNGRRVAPYALADFNEVFTNLDALPLEAVDRIDILKNGASAIYGSDAVAGVINIITRKDYQGINVSVGYEGATSVKQTRQGSAAVTAGIGNLDKDGYNILGNVELFKRDSVISRDVISKINPLRFRAGMIPTTFTGQTSTFSYPGNLDFEPLQGCAPQLVLGGLCRYDRFERFELIPSADRVNGMLSGRLRLSGGIEAFSEVIYSRTETKYVTPFQPYGQAIGPTTWGNPQTNVGQTFIPRGLPATHPLNTTGIEEPDFRYRFKDSPAGSTSTADNYRALAGLKGTWRDFDWETSLGFLGSKVEDKQYGRFSNSGFIEVIGDYTPDTLPADFFNKPGGYRIGEANSAAVIAKLFPSFGSTGKTTQTVVDVKMVGDIGTMAGGPIGLAVGGEVRREKFTITPTDNLARGDIVGFGLSSTNGSRVFSALFSEVSLPVTKSLEVQLAARLDKFPNLGANISPKVGVKWRANDAFMMRGTVETGFRAPNLTETAPSVKFAFSNGTVDPKRCVQAGDLATALRAQAAALPNSDPQKAALDARADNVEQNECSAGVASIVGNNPELKPEKSKSFSLGAVYQPIRELSVTLDYWNIRRRDEINIKSSDELLSAEDAGLPTGSRIDRRPLTASDQSFTTAEQALYGVTAGPLDAITRGFENLFQTRTSGIDVGTTLTLGTPVGKLDITGLAQYLIKYKAFSGVENRFGDNLAGRYGYPRVQANAGFALTTGSWVNGVRMFRTSSTTLTGDFYDPTGTAAWCAARGIAGLCKVPSQNTVDYYVRYTGIRNLSLGMYIANLANKFPAIDFRAQSGTPIPQDPGDAKRRTIRLNADYKF